LLKRG
jgi:hypothetical protein